MMKIIKKVLIVIKKEGIKGIIKRLYSHYNNLEQKEYYNWIKNNTPTKSEVNEQRKHKFHVNPKISIVIPLYNTPKRFLLELIKSVKNQTYTNWELCLADGSDEPLNYLNKIIKKDERIKYKILKENKGISENTNEALKLVSRRLHSFA